mmetsp:Transcript_23254/g.35205  ORF Transcript_23254/g.35205 Transcript_23254/m.35205 type:complete len:166 (+) Transcript_23254:2354-2851(+)
MVLNGLKSEYRSRNDSGKISKNRSVRAKEYGRCDTISLNETGNVTAFEDVEDPYELAEYADALNHLEDDPDEDGGSDDMVDDGAGSLQQSTIDNYINVFQSVCDDAEEMNEEIVRDNDVGNGGVEDSYERVDVKKLDDLPEHNVANYPQEDQSYFARKNYVTSTP